MKIAHSDTLGRPFHNRYMEVRRQLVDSSLLLDVSPRERANIVKLGKKHLYLH